MDDTHKPTRPQEQIKTDLINAQAKQNHYLGLVGTGFATEMLARDLLPQTSQWRSPLIFGSMAVSLGGIIGDIQNSTTVNKLRKELAASTTLSPGH